jgi:hypothetical protein
MKYTKQWLIQCDTQLSDRTKNHACIAFNDQGAFFALYSFEHGGSDYTARIDHTYTQLIDENGFLSQGCLIDNAQMHVYVKCTPYNGFKTEPEIKLVPAKTTPYPNIRQFLSHYTWGDVEGSRAFLNGCAGLLSKIISEFNMFGDNIVPSYVCIGDTNGIPSIPQDNKPPQYHKDVDASAVVNHANTASIKIIGNRELNKLRLIPELLHYQAEPYDHTAKDNWVAHSYPFKKNSANIKDARHNGTWVHDQKKAQPQESILTHYKGEFRAP